MKFSISRRENTVESKYISPLLYLIALATQSKNSISYPSFFNFFTISLTSNISFSMIVIIIGIISCSLHNSSLINKEIEVIYI